METVIQPIEVKCAEMLCTPRNFGSYFPWKSRSKITREFSANKQPSTLPVYATILLYIYGCICGYTFWDIVIPQSYCENSAIFSCYQGEVTKRIEYLNNSDTKVTYSLVDPNEPRSLRVWVRFTAKPRLGLWVWVSEVSWVCPPLHEGLE